MTHLQIGGGQTIEIYHRYDRHVVSEGYVNDYGDYVPTGPGKVYINCGTYEVLHHTPKGVRLANGKLVLHASAKRWALPTKEEALTSFKARLRRNRLILETRLNHVQQAIELAEGVTP